MNTLSFIKTFLGTAILLIAIDYIWVGQIAHSFYDSSLGSLARRLNGSFDPHVPAVILVYVILALGIVLFVLPHASTGIWSALLWGALLGFVTYGVYDATNYAILANYSLKMAIIDVIWGTFLCGIVSLIVSWVSRVF